MTAAQASQGQKSGYDNLQSASAKSLSLPSPVSSLTPMSLRVRHIVGGTLVTRGIALQVVGMLRGAVLPDRPCLTLRLRAVSGRISAQRDPAAVYQSLRCARPALGSRRMQAIAKRGAGTQSGRAFYVSTCQNICTCQNVQQIKG